VHQSPLDAETAPPPVEDLDEGMEDDNCEVHRDVSSERADEQDADRWDADSSGSPASSGVPHDLPWDSEPAPQVSVGIMVAGSHETPPSMYVEITLT
jgi:hypothetical protein